MSARPGRLFRPRTRLLAFGAFAFFAALFLGSPTFAQTQQPYLFATTSVNGQPAVATFTRNDAAGTVTEVANSPFLLKTQNCSPTTIDVKARFLFGPCGDGVSIYTFNQSTGAVAELAASPFAASTSGTVVAVIAESTGQFVYVVKTSPPSIPSNVTQFVVTLDSFTIDAANNTLIHPTTQNFPIDGTFLSQVVDPNHHFVMLFYEQAQSQSNPPLGNGCGILFDTQTGLPVSTGGSLCQTGVGSGEQPDSQITIDAKGDLIGTGALGQILGSFSVTSVSTSDGLVQNEGNYTFDATHSDPSAPSFDPTGQIAYVETSPSELHIFGITQGNSTLLLTELPSSPLPSTIDPTPILNGLPDPAADFVYLGGSNVITSYPIDTTTGYPGAPIVSTLNHTPALSFQPFLCTMPPAGQAVSAPAISVTPTALDFGSVTSGQTSGTLTVTISSTGNESLALNSLAITPAGTPFSEIDNCTSHPLLAPGTSCTVSLTFAPTATGASQAMLVITDNAAGSPQMVSLAGTGIAPPPPSPAVTLMPGTLNFPGTTAQGAASAPQAITIMNSGNASLSFSAAPSLSGANSSDFSITGNTCSSSLAANASCTVTITFAPAAQGVRTVNLVLTDNAANSPQSVTISGTGAAAATFTTASGSSATQSVSPGQTAQFNLQATPGSGFTGTLSFACSGAPANATCSAPNVQVTNGASANFTITVSTSGSAATLAPVAPRIPPFSDGLRELLQILSTLALFVMVFRLASESRKRKIAWLTVACTLLLSCCLAACGGGGGNPTPPPPTRVTPSGTYTIVITPTAAPAAGSKTYQLNAITLTLTVQ